MTMARYFSGPHGAMNEENISLDFNYCNVYESVCFC